MPASDAIRVEGLRELQRAFKLADKTLSVEFRLALRAAAEPVRADAEALARAKIRRIGRPWSEMRIGVTTASVYVAPKQRGRQSRRNPRLRRPNLAGLLLGRSMVPALEQNRARVIGNIEGVLGSVGRAWEDA